MSRALDRHLDVCRQRGLYVDEDFERGHGALRRFARGLVLTVLLATIVATAAAIVRPSAVDALLAPSVMAPIAPQTHHPDLGSHPHFRRAIVRARAPRAFV